MIDPVLYSIGVLVGVFGIVCVFILVDKVSDLLKCAKEIKDILEKPEKDKQEIEKAKKLLLGTKP